MSTAASYTVADAAATFSFGLYSPTPACSTTPVYTVLVDGSATYPAWFTADLTVAHTFIINDASDLTAVGAHTIAITFTDSSISYSNTQTMTLTIIDPCLSTTWIPSVINAMTTSVNLSPSVA